MKSLGQSAQRGSVGFAGLEGVQTRPLQATNQIDVGRHVPMVPTAAASMEVSEPENTGSNVHNSIDLGAAIGQALSRAGLNNKQACLFMEIDPGLWSRQLQGDGHISFQRLLKLPLSFWHEFVPLLAEPVGLSVAHEDIADRALMQAVFALEQLTRSAIQMRQSQRRAG